jgi:predicted metal-dependent hydrolase
VNRPQIEIGIRQTVETYLRDIAEKELPARLAVLVAERRLSAPRVVVRNQRSRWGSCSTRGSIALNWRLIQMPPSVADYIMLHELAHRRQPNHSVRFWREVESLCPSWRESERWLRRYGKDLL